MKYSLIIPCYNEAKNLPALLEKCKALNPGKALEIILVDNGSTDETPGVLAELLPQHPGCRSLRVEINQGYGFGILAGLDAAEGEILGWTHADLQTDPKDFLEGLAQFEKFGSTLFVKGKRRGRKLGDVFFTVGMSVFETILLRKKLWDINAQPTIFSKHFYQNWKNPPNDFSLDLFAYYMAKEKNLPIHRINVYFAKRLHGISSWNINWSAKYKFIKRTIKFSFQLLNRIKT